MRTEQISQTDPIPCIPRPLDTLQCNQCRNCNGACARDCGGGKERTMAPEEIRVRLSRLDEVDLSKVRMKLMLPKPEGKGWSEEYTLEVEKWYRRYLFVCLAHPELKAVPNEPIDEFWHQHILDTRAYAADCEMVFGSFLHHFPYYGLFGDADARDSSFDQTNAVYRLEFGEDCTEMGRPQNCGHSGSGTGCGQGCRRQAPCLATGCGGDNV